MKDERHHSYARALFYMARDSNEIVPLYEDFRRALDLMKTEPGIYKSLMNPVIAAEKKEELIKTFAATQSLRKLLIFLVKGNRLSLFGDIVRMYESILVFELDYMKVSIKTATEPALDVKKELTDALLKRFKKELLLDFGTDSSLIAGIWAKCGDRIFDNTLKKKLSLLKEKVIK